MIAVANDGGGLGLKLVGLRLAPHQAGEFGYLGFVEVEAVKRANFGDETGRKNRTDAGNGVEGVGDGGDLLGNGGVEPFLVGFEKSDVLEGQSQDIVNGLLEGWGQGIRELGHELEFTSVVFRIGKTATTPGINEVGQFSQIDGGDLLNGGKVVEHGSAGGAKDVLEGTLVGSSGRYPA